MSTGTTTIFRLFPIIVPATVDVKPDHTHSLKVTLRGVKNKIPGNSKNLAQSCKARLGTNTAKTKLSQDICDTQIGKLLESIANSSSNSATAAGQ
jgi:hypothetical protein